MISICVLLLVVLQPATEALPSSSYHTRHRRLLPNNQNCDPNLGSCKKGDLLDERVADCKFTRSAKHPVSCTADGNSGSVISWVVAPEKYNLCQPETENVKFVCGTQGSNTRCVCSDYKVKWNKCRCQYWTESTPGTDKPAFCTSHYLGGDSSVHHYSCCNNCNDPGGDTSCDGTTYQGGSRGNYCGHCGKSTGGGEMKWYFNCVNCSVQAQCHAVCNKKVSTRAGFCWKWADCFKGCCEKATTSINSFVMLSDEAIGFCGDTICQRSESPFICPSDCCYQINNSTCPQSSVDLPLCCQDNKCCL